MENKFQSREEWSWILSFSKTWIWIEWKFTIKFPKCQRKFQLHLKMQIDNHPVLFQTFEEGYTGSWLVVDNVWSRNQFNINRFYLEPTIRWSKGHSINQNRQEIAPKWNGGERTHSVKKWFVQFFGSIASSLWKEFPFNDPECTPQLITLLAQLRDACGIFSNSFVIISSIYELLQSNVATTHIEPQLEIHTFRVIWNSVFHDHLRYSICELDEKSWVRISRRKLDPEDQQVIMSWSFSVSWMTHLELFETMSHLICTLSIGSLNSECDGRTKMLEESVETGNEFHCPWASLMEIKPQKVEIKKFNLVIQFFLNSGEFSSSGRVMKRNLKQAWKCIWNQKHSKVIIHWEKSDFNYFRTTL